MAAKGERRKPTKRRKPSTRGAGELRLHGAIWYARWYDADGKRQEKSTETRNRPDAVAYLAERVAEVAKIRTGQARPDRTANTPAGDLLPKWLDGLTNRDANGDRLRARRYLVPKWGTVKLSAIDVAAVMEWIDELRREPAPARKGRRGRNPISDATARHCLNLLSRFLSWAVERGHVARNVVRDVPMGRRPRMSARADVPWIDDDATVRQLVRALPEPIGILFYLGNRAGLRTGELAGLRLSDFAFLDEGAIRVRFSYDGPLKEDKDRSGKVKWAPAPSDAATLLGPYLDVRRAQGAGPEDLAFPAPGGGMFDKTAIGRAWDAATGRDGTRKAAQAARNAARRKRERPGKPGPKPKAPPSTKADNPFAALNWYAATRHSFVSRNLSRGASLDEVSAAVGHSSPVVTRRFYDHFVRRKFSPLLRAGLGLAALAKAAPVVSFRRAKAAGAPGAGEAAEGQAAGGANAGEGENRGKNGGKSEQREPAAGKKKPRNL